MPEQRSTHGFSRFDLAVLYEDSIEEILADMDGKLHPADAVDWSTVIAAVNVERKKCGATLVAVPPDLHDQVNRYAAEGKYRASEGSSRRYGFLKKLAQSTLINEARERADQLVTSGAVRNKTEAVLQAAEEFSRVFKSHGFKATAETVQKLMALRPKL
jgi:hypothetical protein